ncbi:MAG: UDP-N-acetylglucosamine--N-acetylmuramyl-(pentapeptide) pyrophosphoryl-undecaprenol N-acetylglucosamine transferase [Candidatus Saelkia tenebricola]|nr:UDP-N-acetylglucosamine--N-acetylmuramyl-(pentapeptide) pyrophosphoryl-undecaprenol N-acetylglucosamine transferase [Candidatus Saelkia tenebricola]
MKRKRRVFLFAGGSGGHIEPALVLRTKLQEKDQNVLLYLTSNYLISDIKNVKKVIICKNKFKAILQFPYVFLYFLIIGLIKKADVFIGFGGHYSIPGILAGNILRAKTIIYEPNLIWGRANSWLSKKADSIFVIWPDIREHFSTKIRKKIVVIKPLVKIEKSKYNIQNKSKVFSVLITGGSHGSFFLNKLTIDLIRYYNFKKKEIKITLISGRKFYSIVKDRMNELLKHKRLDMKLFDYRMDINKLYQETDLLISRSGAQTVLESIYYNLPAVFIPYPYAYQHQLENAKYLYRIGACYLLEQEFLDYRIVGALIDCLNENPHLLVQVKSRLETVKKQLLTAKDAESIIVNE